jgi:ORF6N domain
MTTQGSIVPIERIAACIYLIRDQKVILDFDLAKLYGVTTGNLNKAVKRNIERFPDDFMFQLTQEEHESLKFQTGIANEGRGGRRTPPYAFTEQGVAMLSSVLHSPQAVQVNVAIMRTFVRMREILATHKDLARKVEEHDRHIAILYDTVKKLLEPTPGPKKRPIGYITGDDEADAE